MSKPYLGVPEGTLKLLLITKVKSRDIISYILRQTRDDLVDKNSKDGIRIHRVCYSVALKELVVATRRIVNFFDFRIVSKEIDYEALPCAYYTNTVGGHRHWGIDLV